MNFYPVIRKCLFLFNAEKTHVLSLTLMSFMHRIGLLVPGLYFLGCGQKKTGHKRRVNHSVEVMGLCFAHPVGLAAGLDKDGEHIAALEQCGFSFIEIGTVTPLPQPGNAKPRLFRLQADQAIINRMGFNNKGVKAMLEQVKLYRNRLDHKRQDQKKLTHRVTYPCLIGINIGKNKITPLEHAVDDYVFCLQQVYAYADYVTINISSPNTPGLRKLQHGAGLVSLLTELKQQQAVLARKTGRYVPLVVKIAPDLTDEDLQTMVQVFIDTGMDGIISGNTTCQRPPTLLAQDLVQQSGGLSGAPLTPIADKILLRLVELLQGKIPVIAAGGIMTAEDARRKLQFGASLVQIYTGFIYSGPALVSQSIDLAGKKNNIV